ncbi:carboxypeptidase regulatory-like domain-containing protein [Granulicella sp. 5B5]|uniref:carboxypeptidase-like regulatory domain-containing protein n=1 Tax=Granulicella sp. 5B5 TaxID=1617967 RepID=UPI0015F63C38|nr:carboxypeptidase-like regulatory domain-containing protein [Granulicella sp. 5B5]QMV19750.1 carboxypeptidase regulatory-like domain-containing protein [Granulicella sp. 5B5]
MKCSTLQRRLQRYIICSVAMLLGSVIIVYSAKAQTGGDGAITGTVADSTGALIPNATVTATNKDTGVVTARPTSASGLYQLSPLIVGTYTVTVAADGFKSFTQQNVVLNAAQVFGLNVTLQPGNRGETVTVNTAPPALDTTNAVLGGTITSKEYMNLPLLVAGNQQRDITQFSNLLPGAQPGARSSLFSGTASRVEEVYLDGIPISEISQIGDNRPIFNLVPSEAIDQIGATTSGQSVDAQGAGSVNYTMASGANQYHGTVADFIRNTIFDTWGFTAPAATTRKLVNGAIQNVPAGKPADHQNEFTATVSGPISIPHLFSGRNKLFFFAAYDLTHANTAPSYSTATVPTALMRTGDFTELLNSTQSAGTGAAGTSGPGYLLYDPTTQSCVGSVCTRQPFIGMKNGLPTPNIIPANKISPIAQTMQSFLPPPTTSGLQNNYLGGYPTGNKNWLYSGRIDYDISPKNRLSFVVTGGNTHPVPYTGNGVLPVPYLASVYTQTGGHWADMQDTYTITPNLVNQFKFGFSNFGGPPSTNLTQGVSQYEAQNMGINFNGLPADAQAVTEFPTQVFAGSNAQTEWGEGVPGTSKTTVDESYTTVDNLLWVKGRHAMTFGIQIQRLELNQSAQDGPTSGLQLNWSTNETSQETGSAYTTSTGYAYASYLLGAVGSASVTELPFSVLGGRFHPVAPYFQDNFKVNTKLTLNLGLRWDYLPTYNEVLDRFSFLNPNLVNPATGNLGALQFAGSYGGPGVSCGCNSPAHNYMKNWGPRLGFAYSVNDKTVVRGAYAVVYSHGGGTGGAGGAYQGTGSLGLTSSPVFSDGGAGTGAGPAFYLNNSSGFQSGGIANSTFGGPGYTFPAITPPGPASQILNVGNYVNSAGAFVTPGAISYLDPYVSGRAPEFDFWNFGIQREIIRDLTIMVNYAGSESHFLAGASNIRGLQSGELNPKYFALGVGIYGAGLLSKPATAANIAAADAIIPGIAAPYSGFVTAAGTTKGASYATIGQMLTWMPQYSGTTDTWGSQTANAAYHSLQVSLSKRVSHGLTFNLNYTYSKQLDDTGTIRSGYAIPAGLTLNGKAWKQDRIDRGLSATSVPQNLAIFGVYRLPFGKGQIGGDHLFSRILLGGWDLSGVFTYVSGAPLALTSTACSAATEPGQGQCMPDVNPNFTGSARQNGSWGRGATAANLGKYSYIRGAITGTTPGEGAGSAACTASSGPFCNSGALMIGDAPRTAPFGLRGPGVYNLNMGVRRSFKLVGESNFIFGVDCQNVTNKVTFSGINTVVNSASFGTISSATSNSGSRDFQFSGRIRF